MQEVRTSGVTFSTIFKITYLSSLSASILAVLLILFLRLLITFPEDKTPDDMKAVMWFFYFLVGPFLSALGLSFAGWLAIRLLGRLKCVTFRFLVDEEPIQAPQTTPLKRRV